MSALAEHLVDIADAAEDLGASVVSISVSRIELRWGRDIAVTIDSRLLTGRLLRSILRPSPDPAYAEPRNSAGNSAGGVVPTAGNSAGNSAPA